MHMFQLIVYLTNIKNFFHFKIKDLSLVESIELINWFYNNFTNNIQFENYLPIFWSVYERGKNKVPLTTNSL